MSLPPPPRDRFEVHQASMPDTATAPATSAFAPAAATLPTSWTDSYTRRPRRPATIPIENQVGSLPYNTICSSPRQIHSQSSSSSSSSSGSGSGSKHHQQPAMAVSRPYPVPLQQHQSTLEHDPEYHPQQSVYDRQQQQQSQYQAYRPNIQTVDYQQQPSPYQQPQQEQALPWPAIPPRALQMRRDSSRTLAPTTVPAALSSVTDLATRSLSLSRHAVTGEEGPGSLVVRGDENSRASPAVAMMVVMNPSGNGELQTYGGSTLSGYDSSGTSRHNSTDSRSSVRKGLLAPPAAAREEDTGAAKRHRAERRRFRIMASLGTITAIATVVLAVFTALNFYYKVQA